MTFNLSNAMVRVIRLALIHAIKDGKKYEQKDGEYTVDLDDAFDLFTSVGSEHDEELRFEDEASRPRETFGQQQDRERNR